MIKWKDASAQNENAKGQIQGKVASYNVEKADLSVKKMIHMHSN